MTSASFCIVLVYHFLLRMFHFLCACSLSWWRHQMETFSALLAICAENSPVHGEFPRQRPVTRSFDVFFDQHPNKRLSKQWWGWWFETLSCPLWRHRNVNLSFLADINFQDGKPYGFPGDHQQNAAMLLWAFLVFTKCFLFLCHCCIPSDKTYYYYLYEPIETLWRHVATQVWVNISSDNGLLPDGTKSLPEPIEVFFSLARISPEATKISIYKLSLKIAFLWKSNQISRRSNDLKTQNDLMMEA